MAKKKFPDPPPEEGPPGVPEWVVTYGDMMSLLLTFFIMLVSMSEIRSDSGESRAAMDSIRESFGPKQGRFGVPGTSPNSKGAMGKRSSNGIRSEGGLKQASRDSEGRGGANDPVKKINHGKQITLGGPAEFGEFSAELDERAQQNLEILAETLRNKPLMIMIRGHATPITPDPQSGFKSPLELSFARAHTVYHQLIKLGLNEDQLYMTAVGDSEPKILTRDPEKQRENRRVDISIMEAYTYQPKTPKPN